MNEETQHPGDKSVTSVPDVTRQDATNRDASRQLIPTDIGDISTSSPQVPEFPPKTITEIEFTTTNDMSRQDATMRDTSGQSATDRDGARHVAPDDVSEIATVEDQQSPDVKQPKSIDLQANVSDWIDIEETAKYLHERGVARTIRTIQRTCKRGDLNCRLVPTESGVRYLIEVHSIDAFITHHNETMPNGSGRRNQNSDREINPVNNNEVGAPTTASTGISNSDVLEEAKSNAAPADPTVRVQLAEIIDLKNEQIAMLKEQLNTTNQQLQVKDEQISTMHERDHETNVLIQNLQNLMALPPSSGRANGPQSSAEAPSIWNN